MPRVLWATAHPFIKDNLFSIYYRRKFLSIRRW